MDKETLEFIELVKGVLAGSYIITLTTVLLQVRF